MCDFCATLALKILVALSCAANRANHSATQVMAFLRFQCDDDDLEEFRGNVGLAARSLVLCPVTDTSAGLSADATGTHWSLLAFWRGTGGAGGLGPCFEHFDSCGSANASAARATAEVLWRALHVSVASGEDESSGCAGGGGGERGGGRAAPLPPCPPVEACPAMPRQTNGVDCGAHALCAAAAHVEALAAAWVAAGVPAVGAGAAAPRGRAAVKDQAEASARGEGAASGTSGAAEGAVAGQRSHSGGEGGEEGREVDGARPAALAALRGGVLATFAGPAEAVAKRAELLGRAVSLAAGSGAGE